MCSLAWMLTPALGAATCWAYFCQRMALRHRLRRQLRQVATFLDPSSAAALRPAAPLEALREVEAALQVGAALMRGDVSVHECHTELVVVPAGCCASIWLCCRTPNSCLLCPIPSLPPPRLNQPAADAATAQSI